MPNITVTLSEEAYRRARIRAAELDTSVSALVRQFLTDIGAGETDFERQRRHQNEVLATVTRFRAGRRLSRDEVHDRAVR